MKLEHNELLSIENSLKSYDKLELRIKQYIVKHKITDSERSELDKNWELSKSMTYDMKTEGIDGKEKRRSVRLSGDSVRMED